MGTEEELGEMWGTVGKAAAGMAMDKFFNEEEDIDENFILAADEARDKGLEEFEYPKGSGKMHPVTIKAEIDEESELKIKGVEDMDMGGAEEEILNIFNESKVNKTLSKYFQLTPQEKKQKRLIEQKRRKQLKTVKDNFLNETVKEIKTRKLLESHFRTYEQEKMTKKFLKENKNFNFIGKNKRGGLVFKRNNNLVEISIAGRII